MSFELQARVWKLEMRPSSVKYVLLCLSHRANNDGFCWPSVTTISKDTGLDAKTVRAAVSFLEDAGFLQVDRRSGRSNHFQLDVKFISSLVDTPTESGSSTPTDITSATPAVIGIGKVSTPTENGSTPLPKTEGHPSQKRQTNISRTSKEPIKKAQAKKTSLPKDFVLTDRHRDWAAEHKIQQIEKHFAYFVDACEAKGYQYANWDKAFYNAVRSNWAKIDNAANSSTKVAGVYAA